MEKYYCRECGSVLSRVIWGYIGNRQAIRSQYEGENLYWGGCLCFGDERDAKFICPKCGIEYMNDMSVIEYMTCPLESSGAILKGDCINKEIIHKRKYYKYLEHKDVICNLVCPNVGKEVIIRTKDGKVITGEILRTHLTSVRIEEEHLSVKRKIAEFKYESEDVLLEDIASIEAVSAE